MGRRTDPERSRRSSLRAHGSQQALALNRATATSRPLCDLSWWHGSARQVLSRRWPDGTRSLSAGRIIELGHVAGSKERSVAPLSSQLSYGTREGSATLCE